VFQKISKETIMKQVFYNVLILFFLVIPLSLRSENLSLYSDYTIEVSDSIKQKIGLGVDAERLWYWRSPLKDRLAELAVKEMNSKYVRVAIACDYEREKGVIKPEAYSMILEMMTAMKKANPEILFFASPRPLHEAYTEQEKIAEWGGKDNVPWSCYPRWILQWNQDGTKKLADGTIVPKWVQGDFDVPALAQYFADYLNLMYSQGFQIDYLDATNEKAVITPAINKYLYDNIPPKLNSGVKMPQLIVPSSWNVQNGINWLDSINIDNLEHEAFAIASVHNTGDGGSPSQFASKANALHKEAWNTELHDWIGITLGEEVLSSEVFWQYLQAGFTGIDTWLFFGPAAGKPHSMIWASNTDIIKSGKYEIFKQVVNNANGGNYIAVSNPSLGVFVTAAFLKDSILSVWVLNKQSTTFQQIGIQLPEVNNILGKTIDVIRWKGGETTNAGEQSSIVASESNKFYSDIVGESLYFFKINLGNTTAIYSPKSDVPELMVFQHKPDKIFIKINGVVEDIQHVDYKIVSLDGKIKKNGKLLSDISIVDATNFSRGMYVVTVQMKNYLLYKKLIIR
jgi:hypothetical protein